MALTVVSQPSDKTFTGNPVLFEIASTIGGTRPFVDGILEIDAGGGWETLYMSRENVAGGQNCFFDMRKPLRDYLFRKQFLPAYNGNTVSVVTENTIPYRMNFSEYNASGGTDNITSSDLLAVKGGISRQQFTPLSYLSSYMTANKKFLTWKPDKLRVTTAQQEFLFFMITGSVTAFDIHIAIYNGTGTTNYTMTGATGLSDGSIVCIPVGYTALDVAANTPSGTEAVHYSVVLKSGSTVISETRTYFVDHEEGLFNRYLLFQNSLGGMDTLRITGKNKYSTENKDSDASFDFYSLYTASDIPNERLSTEETFKSTAASGFLSASSLDWMRELRLSRFMFEDRSGKFIACKLTNNSLKLLDENSDLRFTELEITDAFSNSYYTPESL